MNDFFFINIVFKAICFRKVKIQKSIIKIQGKVDFTFTVSKLEQKEL